MIQEVCIFVTLGIPIFWRTVVAIVIVVFYAWYIPTQLLHHSCPLLSMEAENQSERHMKIEPLLKVQSRLC